VPRYRQPDCQETGPDRDGIIDVLENTMQVKSKDPIDADIAGRR
jgi:hypothetical protein